MNKRHRTLPGMDDNLADFTDRLLAGESVPLGEKVASKQELEEMKQTVSRIHAAFPPQDPDPAMKNRLRLVLAAELRKTIPGAAGSGRGRRSLKWDFRWGLAIAAALILVGVIFFLPSGFLGTTGAAGSTLPWIPVIIFLLIVAGLVIWQVLKK